MKFLKKVQGGKRQYETPHENLAKKLAYYKFKGQLDEEGEGTFKYKGLTVHIRAGNENLNIEIPKVHFKEADVEALEALAAFLEQVSIHGGQGAVK